MIFAIFLELIIQLIFFHVHLVYGAGDSPPNYTSVHAGERMNGCRVVKSHGELEIHK